MLIAILFITLVLGAIGWSHRAHRRYRDAVVGGARAAAGKPGDPYAVATPQGVTENVDPILGYTVRTYVQTLPMANQLFVGDSVISANKIYKLSQQLDGMLCLFKTTAKSTDIVWSSQVQSYMTGLVTGKDGKPVYDPAKGSYTIMVTDGTLLEYSGHGGGAIWKAGMSGPIGPKYFLYIRDDGTVVVAVKGAKPGSSVWQLYPVAKTKA